jgi:hypothetical protein
MPAPSQPADDKASKEGNSFRDAIALFVLILSVVGVLLISTLIISLDHDSADKVFSAIIPLFGTWVGTVLAFYFSKENFESASRSLHQAIASLSDDEKLKAKPIKEAMIARAKMSVIVMQGDDDRSVDLPSLQSKLGPNITRIPVLNANESVRYVLHESLIYKFVSEKSGAGAFDPKQFSLADLVSHATIGPQLTLYGIIRIDGTLADAKQAMEKIPGAQDVFVTQSGTKSDPVQGWLTNVDITKNIQST